MSCGTDIMFNNLINVGNILLKISVHNTME